MLKRKYFAACLIAVVLTCFSGAAIFAQSDIDDHRTCSQCGMDRKAYGYSRMLIRYQDGTEVGVCSLHCAVVDMDANKARALQSLLIADRDTRALIDVEKAIWVVGGTKRGVMTQRPAWAFASRTAADAFMRSYGGEIAAWSDVLASARSEAALMHR
jgi:nitrous oxide reductase accessory protein NosL